MLYSMIVIQELLYQCKRELSKIILDSQFSRNKHKQSAASSIVESTTTMNNMRQETESVCLSDVEERVPSIVLR